jgi:hypothetical protein
MVDLAPLLIYAQELSKRKLDNKKSGLLDGAKYFLICLF